MFRPAALSSFLVLLVWLAIAPRAADAQQQQKKSDKEKLTVASASTASPQQEAAALTRTTIRHEVRRFAYGGTVTIFGAPAGSITIEGWARNEVDITAEIELHAVAEEDFARLSAVNGFIIDEDVNHLRLLTTGMHDKAFMKRTAKDFPKRLLGLPWKIDYRIRLPLNTDLEIDAGRGPINLSGVEGLLRLNALESDAALVFTGGAVTATIGRGIVNVSIPARSWRGAGADIRLATGELNVQLPAGFNADLNADILRTGRIENGGVALQPREDAGTNTDAATPRSLRVRAGSGGASLSFTVGDGTLRLNPQPQ